MYIIYTYIEQMQVTVNSNNKLALGLFCSIGFGGVIFIQSLICLFLYLLVCLLTCIIITIFFFRGRELITLFCVGEGLLKINYHFYYYQICGSTGIFHMHFNF